jgi:hypothetical protein
VVSRILTKAFRSLADGSRALCGPARTVGGMNKTHIFVIAVVLGIAVMLGVFAASRTAHLGAAARSANQAQILQREKRLTAAEQGLRKALAKSPAAAATPTPVARTPRTVYVRPAPIIIHKHRSGGESEGGSEGRDD